LSGFDGIFFFAVVVLVVFVVVVDVAAAVVAIADAAAAVVVAVVAIVVSQPSADVTIAVARSRSSSQPPRSPVSGGGPSAPLVFLCLRASVPFPPSPLPSVPSVRQRRRHAGDVVRERAHLTVHCGVHHHRLTLAQEEPHVAVAAHLMRHQDA
jgi:hypothetical protein